MAASKGNGRNSGSSYNAQGDAATIVGAREKSRFVRFVHFVRFVQFVQFVQFVHWICGGGGVVVRMYESRCLGAVAGYFANNSRKPCKCCCKISRSACAW